MECVQILTSPMVVKTLHYLIYIIPIHGNPRKKALRTIILPKLVLDFVTSTSDFLYQPNGYMANTPIVLGESAVTNYILRVLPW
jgi:hypothetical protein